MIRSNYYVVIRHNGTCEKLACKARVGNRTHFIRQLVSGPYTLLPSCIPGLSIVCNSSGVWPLRSVQHQVRSITSPGIFNASATRLVHKDISLAMQGNVIICKSAASNDHIWVTSAEADEIIELCKEKIGNSLQ